MVNMEKSELELKQAFDFIGYQFNIKPALAPAGWFMQVGNRKNFVRAVSQNL